MAVKVTVASGQTKVTEHQPFYDVKWHFQEGKARGKYDAHYFPCVDCFDVEILYLEFSNEIFICLKLAAFQIQNIFSSSDENEQI